MRSDEQLFEHPDAAVRPPAVDQVCGHESLDVHCQRIAPAALGLGQPVMRDGKLGAMIEKAGKGAVRGLQLFDVFRGESLGEGKKSLAYHVVLQSDTKTLTDKDAQKFLGRLERSLEQQGAALRS